MTELSLFDFQGNTVRLIQDEHGEPWWVAKDVALILGYRDAPDLTRRLDRDEYRQAKVSLPPTQKTPNMQVRRMNLINEPGLYAAIVRSSKPIAKPFRKWVTAEVLPSIRKHGGYLTPEATKKAITDPDFIIRLAEELKAERMQRQTLEQQALENRPKVEFAEAVEETDGTISVGDLAKLLRSHGLDIGQNRLFEWLRENEYLISARTMNWNAPTQRSLDKGWLSYREHVHRDRYGIITITRTPLVTGKGQRYFVQKLLAEWGAYC